MIPVQDMTKVEYQYFKAKSRERKGHVVVDFQALMAGDESQNLLLRREDRIIVPATRTTVTVTGAVASHVNADNPTIGSVIVTLFNVTLPSLVATN